MGLEEATELALRAAACSALCFHADAVGGMEERKKGTLVISLAVWSLMAWEHGAESTGESSNIMRPYLQVRLAETVMESRKRRPVCVCMCAHARACVRRMWKTNEHRNVG